MKANVIMEIDYSDRYWFKRNSKTFKQWFDPKTFKWNEKDKGWENFSIVWLAEYCSDHFDDWWDPDKFPISQSGHMLMSECSEHFEKWWDPDNPFFDKWDNIKCIDLKDHFDVWFDPDKFGWWYSTEAIVKYCPEHFNKWWDIDKFFIVIEPEGEVEDALNKKSKEFQESFLSKYIEDRVKMLFEYCMDYVDIWGPEVKMKYPKWYEKYKKMDV
jgi:hypothetical protein